MAKEGISTFAGQIGEILPNGRFAVRVDDGGLVFRKWTEAASNPRRDGSIRTEFINKKRE
jgi:hypothetical protein